MTKYKTEVTLSTLGSFLKPFVTKDKKEIYKRKEKCWVSFEVNGKTFKGEVKEV